MSLILGGGFTGQYGFFKGIMAILINLTGASDPAEMKEKSI